MEDVVFNGRSKKGLSCWCFGTFSIKTTALTGFTLGRITHIKDTPLHPSQEGNRTGLRFFPSSILPDTFYISS